MAVSITEFPNAHIKLLYFVTALGYVSRKALTPVAGNPAALSRGVDFLLSHHYIKEATATETIHGGPNRSVVYYQPTQLGINYLASQAERLPAEAQWVHALSAQTKQRRLTKDSRISGRERMARYLQISASASFAAVAGCNIKSIALKRLDSDETQTAATGGGERRTCEAGGGNTVKGKTCEAEGCEAGDNDTAKPQGTDLLSVIREITYHDTDLEQKGNGTIMNPGADVLYIDAYQVKDRLRKQGVSMPVLRVGRYAGIVESPLKSVLLYVGTRRGMGWSNQAVGSDAQAYQAYNDLVSRHHSTRRGEWHGALLVENAKMFEDIYQDKMGKRGKGEVFAKGFLSMQVFPMTREGALLFEKYLTVDTSELQAEFVEAAVASGFYQKNLDGDSRQFPLVNFEGVRMAVGLFIDAVQIRKLVKIHERDKKPMGIVCYAWQQDYYRRVIPDGTLFMTVS